MAKCKQCGAILRSGAVFCQECGYNPKNSAKPSKGKEKGLTIGFWANIVLAIIIGAGIIWGFTAIFPKTEIQESRTYTYNSEIFNVNQTLLINGEIADIEIIYNSSNIEELVEIELTVDFSGRFISASTLDELCTISWENTTDIVSFTVDYNLKRNSGFSDSSSILVYLRTDINYNLTVYGKDSQIYINVPKDVQFQDLIVESTSKNIELKLNDNVKILNTFSAKTTFGNLNLTAENVSFEDLFIIGSDTGKILLELERNVFKNDVEIKSLSGDITMDLSNCSYVNSPSFKISNGIGKIIANITQFMSMESNISPSFQTTSGNITIYFNGDTDLTGAQFIAASEGGNVSLNDLGGFSDLLGNTLTSTNILADNNYFFSLISVKGSIEVFAKVE